MFGVIAHFIWNRRRPAAHRKAPTPFRLLIPGSIWSTLAPARTS